MYVVSNKSKIVDTVRMGIDDDEWVKIRHNILRLESVRLAEQIAFDHALKEYVGPLAGRHKLENTLLKRYPYSQITNDEILLHAINSGTANITDSDKLITFDNFIEKYQLKTCYGELSKKSRNLIQQFICQESYKASRIQTYIAVLQCVAILQREWYMLDTLQSKGLLAKLEIRSDSGQERE
jgi:hypothetical protein